MNNSYPLDVLTIHRHIQRNKLSNSNLSNHDGARKLSRSAQRREDGIASIQSSGCSGLVPADLKTENSYTDHMILSHRSL